MSGSDTYRRKHSPDISWLNEQQHRLLMSVPLRGTNAWDARELLRERCGCKALSFGSLPGRVRAISVKP